MNCVVWQFLIFLFQVFGQCYSANILILNAWQSKSHAMTMLPLAEKLKEKGHNVTMYHHGIAPLGSISTKVKQLETLGSNSVIQAGYSVAQVFWYYEVEPLIYDEPYRISYNTLKSALDDEKFRNILNTKFHVVLVDETFPLFQAIVALRLRQKFGTRIGIFSTTDQNILLNQYKGLERNPVTEMNFYTPHSRMYEVDNQYFSWRLRQFWTHLQEIYLHLFVDFYYIQKGGELLQLSTSISDIFTHSLFTVMEYPLNFGYTVTKSSNFFHVMDYCIDANRLEGKYLSFIEDPTYDAIIYVAFGSITNWNVAPEGMIDKFVNAMNNLTEYKIIWSYNGPSIDHLIKPHVMITAWAPQHEILNHPKVKAFFTHGGLKSIKEGICTATPFLFFPLFADQPKNSANAILIGIAEAVNKRNLTAEEISEKLRKIVKEPRYAKNMNRFRSTFIDRPIHPLEEASHFIGKLARNSKLDEKLFRSKRYGIGVFDFHMITVIVLIFTPLILCISL